LIYSTGFLDIVLIEFIPDFIIVFDPDADSTIALSTTVKNGLTQNVTPVATIASPISLDPKCVDAAVTFVEFFCCWACLGLIIRFVILISESEGASTDILLGSFDAVVDVNNLLFVRSRSFQRGIISMILTGWWTSIDVANNALFGVDVVVVVDVVVDVDEDMIWDVYVVMGGKRNEKIKQNLNCEWRF